MVFIPSYIFRSTLKKNFYIQTYFFTTTTIDDPDFFSHIEEIFKSKTLDNLSKDELTKELKVCTTATKKLASLKRYEKNSSENVEKVEKCMVMIRSYKSKIFEQLGKVYKRKKKF